MVADVLRLTQVTHPGLAVRDPTCHPHLRGVVCLQNMDSRHLLRAVLSKEWCKMHSVLRTKSLPSIAPKISHKVLILALGGPSGHAKDWSVTLENGPSPLALRGAVATVRGGGGASRYF